MIYGCVLSLSIYLLLFAALAWFLMGLPVVAVAALCVGAILAARVYVYGTEEED